jgi:hypothetical protein
MKAFARLESLIQEIIERPALLFSPRRVHPLAIANAITRALETEALPLADRTLVPNRYQVRLNPDDASGFETVRPTLEREMAEYVARLALERGLALNGAARVSLEPDATVRPGTVSVSTAFTDEEPESYVAATALRPPPAAGHTERILPVRAPAARPPEAKGGTAVLELLDERGAVTDRVPVRSLMVIGRRSTNDVSLADAEVSREHARVEARDGRYFISDLGSTNGTTVNGRPIAAARALTDGDVIMLGRSRLRFRQGG